MRYLIRQSKLGRWTVAWIGEGCEERAMSLGLVGYKILDGLQELKYYDVVPMKRAKRHIIATEESVPVLWVPKRHIPDYNGVWVKYQTEDGWFKRRIEGTNVWSTLMGGERTGGVKTWSNFMVSPVLSIGWIISNLYHLGVVPVIVYVSDVRVKVGEYSIRQLTWE